MAKLICRYLDGTTKLFNSTERLVQVYENKYKLEDVISDIKVNGSSIGIEDRYNLSLSDEVEITLIGNVIPVGLFSYVQLSSVKFSNDIVGIESYAFRNCKLMTLVIPDSVTSIGEVVFQSCKDLKSVAFGGGNVTIGQSIFSECENLKTVKIGEGITSIPKGAFTSCYALETITIPDNVRSIEASAFQMCKKLKEVSIGSGCGSIGKGAFIGCTSLEKIYIKNNNCGILYDTFSDGAYYENNYPLKEGGTLYYPTNTDYSSWLSSDKYYLGYYGWNGRQMGVSGMPATVGITIGNGESIIFKVGEINVSNKKVIVDYSAGTYTTTINTKYLVDFQAFENSSWLNVVTSDYGNDDYGIDISYGENTAKDMRSTTITLSGIDVEDNSIVETIQFIQKGTESEPKITAFTTTINVDFRGNPQSPSLTEIGCGYAFMSPMEPMTSEWIIVGDGVEATGTFIGYDTVMFYPISFLPNIGNAREGSITFWGVDDEGEEYTALVKVNQQEYNGKEPVRPNVPVDEGEYIGPIWKDVVYDFGNVSVIEYYVYTEAVRYSQTYDKLLFVGRSYLRPNSTSNKILVNKICQDYMTIPLLSKDAVSVDGGYQVIKLKDSDGRIYKTFRFVNDWTYEDSFETGILSHPILNDNKVYRNQLLPFTLFGAKDVVTTNYGIQYSGRLDEYGQPMQDWNSVADATNNVVTQIFPYSGKMDGAVSYTIGNKKYDIVDECVNYVLYYLNPWGGYDWFPIRGKVVERDTMTSYMQTQNFNNQTWEFGKRKYLTEINKHYTLHTGWMSEDESSRMWYLLQSNIVYLHNLDKNEIYPVIITNSEQEHKKRLMGTRISYQIEVDLSQSRTRI